MFRLIFLYGDAPKSGSAWDLGNCLQSRNVPFGTFGDYAICAKKVKWERRKRLNDNALLVEKLYRISARKQTVKEVQKMREKENAW